MGGEYQQQTFRKYYVPPITKSMVKQRLIFLLLSIGDAHYMHDRYMLGESLGTTRLASDEQHNNNKLLTNRQLSHSLR